MPRNCVQKARHRIAVRKSLAADERMMKISGIIGAVAVVGLIILAACTTPREKVQEIHDELVYFKDHRSGLCFAYWMYEGDSRCGVMSEVPCEKV